MKQKIIDNLRCYQCFRPMQATSFGWRCSQCGIVYQRKNQVIFALEETGQSMVRHSNDAFINRLKVRFKKYPYLFNFLYYAFGAVFLNRSPQQFIQQFKHDKLILNLGSGIKAIRPDVINVDFYPFQNVDLVADISRLPLADNSVDAVIIEFVLEHVPQPTKIIQEIYRVLKPGGLIYVAVPFVENFHSSPYDYYRWTHQGLQESLSAFEKIELKMRCGPTSALVAILQEWLALVFSFGIKKLQQILVIFFMVALSPLKLLDFIIFKLPNADSIAFAFYFIGRKR